MVWEQQILMRLLIKLNNYLILIMFLTVQRKMYYKLQIMVQLFIQLLMALLMEVTVI